MSDRLKKIQKALLEITKDCREDMHEPDEQEITALVSGYYLDNAMGENPNHNSGEFTVGLRQGEEHFGDGYKWFNLADLIALARKACFEGDVKSFTGSKIEVEDDTIRISSSAKQISAVFILDEVTVKWLIKDLSALL